MEGPAPRANAALCYANSTVFLFGGTANLEGLLFWWFLNVETWTWTEFEKHEKEKNLINCGVTL